MSEPYFEKEIYRARCEKCGRQQIKEIPKDYTKEQVSDDMERAGWTHGHRPGFWRCPECSSRTW
jgi:uncharacterized protein with PIN domain